MVPLAFSDHFVDITEMVVVRGLPSSILNLPSSFPTPPPSPACLGEAQRRLVTCHASHVSQALPVMVVEGRMQDCRHLHGLGIIVRSAKVLELAVLPVYIE